MGDIHIWTSIRAILQKDLYQWGIGYVYKEYLVIQPEADSSLPISFNILCSESIQDFHYDGQLTFVASFVHLRDLVLKVYNARSHYHNHGDYCY